MAPRLPPRVARSAKIGALAITLIAGAEGLRTVAYHDPVGIPTICFGETRGVKIGDTATAAECRRILADRLRDFSGEVDACLRPRVPDETYVAFLSFAYNVGPAAFCRSTLARKANAGDLVGACEELPRWVYARGIRLPGLAKRRQEELALCLRGVGRAM